MKIQGLRAVMLGAVRCMVCPFRCCLRAPVTAEVRRHASCITQGVERPHWRTHLVSVLVRHHPLQAALQPVCGCISFLSDVSIHIYSPGSSVGDTLIIFAR